MNERWLPISGHPGYEVSDLGRVRSVDRVVKFEDGRVRQYDGQILKLMESTWGGYLVARFGITGRSLVHRAVAKAFLELDPSKRLVNHKDGNKQNNTATNLEWVTKSENGTHGYRTLGRKPARETPVVMGDIWYPNLLAAGRANGVTAGAVHQALHKGYLCQGQRVSHG